MNRFVCTIFCLSAWAGLFETSTLHAQLTYRGTATVDIGVYDIFAMKYLGKQRFTTPVTVWLRQPYTVGNQRERNPLHFTIGSTSEGKMGSFLITSATVASTRSGKSLIGCWISTFNSKAKCFVGSLQDSHANEAIASNRLWVPYQIAPKLNYTAMSMTMMDRGATQIAFIATDKKFVAVVAGNVSDSFSPFQIQISASR